MSLDGMYDWASDNPLGLLSLGVGAAGTGMGIWDQYHASKQQEDRRKLAENFSRMGPTAYNPNWSPEQLQAMYFRPAASFMASQGITDGGAFRQALADAAVKAEADRNQIGNQIYQSRLGALGYGPTRQPTGNVGGFGAALQNLMLMNAMNGKAPYRPQQYGQQQQPGAVAPWGTFGGDAGRNSMYGQMQNNQWLMDNPMPPAYQIGNEGTGFSLRGNPGYQPNWSPPDSFYGDMSMSQFDTLPGSQ